MEAKKGAGGGFRLTRPASAICLEEALAPVEQLVTDQDCILGNEGCDGRIPCALHGRWAAIRLEMLDFLRSTHLDALGDRRFAPRTTPRLSKEVS